MNIKECFEKRLLKKGRPDRLKSEKALEISEKNLLRAERLLKHGKYCVITYRRHAEEQVLYPPCI